MSSKENIIELEGIEFKCFSLIEYSSLCQLLKLLAKKYKDLEKKLGILDGRMIEKDKRISELEIMLKGASQSKDDKFPSIKKDTSGGQDHKKTEKKQKKEEKKVIKDDFLDDDYTNEKDTDTDKNKNVKDDKTKEEKVSENGEDLKEEEKKDESQKALSKAESNLNKSLNEEKEKDDNDFDNKKDNEEDKEEEKEKEEDNKEENKEENKEDEDDGKEIENGGKKDQEDNLSEKEDKVISQGNKVVITDISKRGTDVENRNDLLNAEDNKRRNAEIVEQKELINKIMKKLKAHDKQINDLVVKSNEHAIMNKNIKKNKNDIEDVNKKLAAMKASIDEINEKLLKFNEEFENVKVKVQDFNVYDLFQGNGEDGGSLDAAKVLVMNLENKIFKKFGIYDERNKKNDKDLFKIQEDVKNALALVDGMKTNTKRNTDSINELNENYNKTNANYENLLKDLQNQIDLINAKINTQAAPDFSEIKKDFDKKLKNLEEKLNSRIDLFLNREPVEKESSNGPELRVEDLALLKELRRRIGELEKFVSSGFDRINADDMKNRITVLETELPKKASKYELNELKEKVKSLDDFAKDLNFKVDSLQQFTEKVRLDLTQIIKKIEFLSGEYSKLAFKNLSKNNDEGKGPIVDMSKFLDINSFNENKKDVNNKFEKVRLGFEDLSREIEEILSKLAHTPTDKDFSQFQNIVKNMLDEFKINCNKKYADKFDTAKSIKFLETQIRTIQESYNRRSEGGDNWLLAKKPINNYVCASCEANIRGELDKRTDYIAWNKYPQREDKAYRLGHGFSRMLQMVNEDIIRSAGEKGYSSDEDKKLNPKNYNVNASVKLPKVNKRKPAPGGQVVMTEPNLSGSPYDDVENGDSSNNINPNKPQIVRVVRKNKGYSPSPHSTINREVITHRNNEYSVIERTMPSNEDLPPTINNNENDS